MKINYKKTHTVLFVEQYDNRNAITGIGIIPNNHIEDFANNWEKQEKAINLISTSVPEDIMDILRKEFEDIEKELRKK
jgi:hypothetical protein